ncbi:MAG: SAM-dependent DNA methyltransferase, partial [Gammaproteobacteria bacterium]|nr:SAM-dependent DNA methyltransferase [Gammaproteobacteria bacterium]
MAIKKSDLYSSLWASCDELRGGMDASQYKDYVLFMLFIKYITDKYGNSTDFAPPVTIPRGASFKDMLDLRGKSDIGDKINTQVIAPLVNANDRLARSDFPDFNDSNKLGEGQAKVDRLTNLVNIFASPQLDFSQNRAEHDDILGDAYEYLMRHFATESGKSKGQFYTPAEVSRVIAKVIGISPKNTKASTTAYDPTCGSGSLLLKVAAEAAPEAGKQITLEGQEKDVTTAGLARMNMILHDFPTANIVSGNTLAAPKFKDGEQLRTYDYVVANPPFSDKTWTTGLTPSKDPFQRFAWGEPPTKQGDYAYLLHIIRSLKGAGKGACILPHGVLFRGGAEAVIRQQLVRSGYLKGIIGLPANLFYGTGIPACIVVLDKENAAGRKGVFMIDASKGFRKDGPKNRLREQDLHKIVDTFTRQADVPRYARMVPLDEIADPKNDFNLNLRRYIDSTEPEDLQDIDGHLRGGIPERDLDALGAYWKVLPSVRGALFEAFDKTGSRLRYARLKPALIEVKSAIFGHAEFSAFQQQATKVFADWRKATTPRLTGFGKDEHPKALIETIAEELLAAFRQAPLLDAYDIYQHLMDYWAETMQDDCYLIAADGWVKGAQPREIVQVKDKNNKLTWPEPHDYLKGKRRFKSDLVPAPILINRYFAAERDAIEALDNQLTA